MMNSLKSRENIQNSQSFYKKIDNYVFYFADYLGQGGFSKVYKGTHIITKQVVAIKITQLNSLKSKKMHELLASEIDVLKKLSHPNILKCHEVLSSKQHCYIITELCNGGDLESKVRKERYLSQKAAKPLIRDILLGMLYLQQNNIVHRDLKIANVFLHNGTVKVADFGFAKVTKSDFKDFNIGSPIYMAPEGFIHHWYGPKTDVWAFGILIFELLHGKTPYSHCKEEAELKQQIMRPITRHHFRTGISQDIIEAITRCLEINSENRPTFKQLSRYPYFKKIMKGSVNLGSATQKLTQHSSMHQLNQFEAIKLATYGKLVKEETHKKMRSNSSHKILQTPHQFDALKTKKKHESYLRVNTSRSNEKSKQKTNRNLNQFHHKGLVIQKMLNQNPKSNIQKFLGQKQYFSSYQKKLMPELPTSKKLIQNKHSEYTTNNKKLIIETNSQTSKLLMPPQQVTQNHQSYSKLLTNKNLDNFQAKFLSEALKYHRDSELSYNGSQLIENIQNKFKHHYYIPSRISPEKSDIKNTTVTNHNSHLTSKTIHDIQELNQLKNRLKTQQFWDYHSKLFLWPKLNYKESIGILHYCRLLYKFVMILKNALNSLKKQSTSRKNKLSANQEDKRIILDGLVRNQGVIYSKWVMTLLEEMKQKIDRGDIILIGEGYQKQNKLKNVCHEYYEKYCESLEVDNEQISSLKLDSKSAGIRIEKSLETVYKLIDRQITNTKHNEDIYILLAHFLFMMIDSTKKLNEGLRSGSMTGCENSEIQKFLNKNEETFDIHSYVLMKRKYLSEKPGKGGSNPCSNKSSVLLEKIFHEI